MAFPSLHLHCSSIRPRPIDNGDVPLHLPWRTWQASLIVQREEGPVSHEDKVRIMPPLQEPLLPVEASSSSCLPNGPLLVGAVLVTVEVVKFSSARFIPTIVTIM
jgi:hypothetical protein